MSSRRGPGLSWLTMIDLGDYIQNNNSKQIVHTSIYIINHNYINYWLTDLNCFAIHQLHIKSSGICQCDGRANIAAFDKASAHEHSCKGQCLRNMNLGYASRSKKSPRRCPNCRFFGGKECARTLQEFRLDRGIPKNIHMFVHQDSAQNLAGGHSRLKWFGSGRNVPVDTLALNVALGTGVAANHLQVGNCCRWFDWSISPMRSGLTLTYGWPQNQSELPLQKSSSNSEDFNTARSYVNGLMLSASG